jgi:hypothetical protein
MRVIVFIRGGHWAYSCGLVHAVRSVAESLHARGVTITIASTESSERIPRIAKEWGIEFPWLPENESIASAEKVGCRDTQTGMISDGVALLDRESRVVNVQDFDGLDSSGSVAHLLTAIDAAPPHSSTHSTNSTFLEGQPTRNDQVFPRRRPIISIDRSRTMITTVWMAVEDLLGHSLDQVAHERAVLLHSRLQMYVDALNPLNPTSEVRVSHLFSPTRGDHTD